MVNVEGDFSFEYIVKVLVSMMVCFYGYWVEKCGDYVMVYVIFDKCIVVGYVGVMFWKGLFYEDGSGIE